MERQQSLRAPPSLRGDSLSREAMALDSQRSLANGSLAWPWSNSSMDKSTHAKAEKFVRPVAKHHFGLLDVPQPETFFASSQLPGNSDLSAPIYSGPWPELSLASALQSYQEM